MFKEIKNLTRQQQAIRIVGGLGLIILALGWLADWPRAIIIIVGTYGLVTGVVGYCPILEIFFSNRPFRHRR